MPHHHHATAIERARFLMMLEATQRLAFCCFCVGVPFADQRRAKRIFRLTRHIHRRWNRDRLEHIIADEPPTAV